MSWLYSRVLVEEYLGDISLDGEQSVQLNGSLTPQAYCAPDKMKVFSRLSRFGMTYKPLTESRGEELLTLYLEDFHAKTLAQQEKVQGLTENDQECGHTWRGWLARYDPDTSLWRTAQCSLLEDLNESLAILPRSGMTRSGLLWELPMLEQTTKGTEFGLSEKWPTPRSCSAMAATITPESAWNEKRNPNLETIVGQKMWPTPTSHNAKETNAPSEALRNTPTLAAQAGGKLNPDWVEWLMNWPIKWSDLNGFDAKEFERWKKASTASLQESVQMRTVWWDRDPSQASHRPQHEQQQEQQHCNSLHEVSRGTSCESTLERSHERQDLLVLRKSIHLQTTQGKNLQSGVREQTCMDETQIVSRVGGTRIATVDRLKAIGNGQVPLCAATAWRLLSDL